MRPVLLILRALGLGDLLTAVPALRALRDAFPEHERVLATPAYLAPLALCTGAVSRVLDARPLEPLRWPGPPPAIAVNLHGRGPQSHALLAALAPQRMVAFAPDNGAESAAMPRWRFAEHEVARWCRMLAESGIPADPARLDLDVPADCGPARGATLLHPGAASAARRWPAERWSALARALTAQGHRVVISGGPSEIELAGRVARGAGLPPESVLAGRAGVLELAGAVSAAARVVSGDTGVAHLATALRRPSVVLFGPTSPRLWGPPPERRWHRALWAGTSGDPHADRPDRGLLRLHVSDVLRALRGLPAAAPRLEAA